MLVWACRKILLYRRRNIMKGKIKTVAVCIIVAAVMILTSCGNVFTTSLGKVAARDPEKAAKALAKKSTSTLVSDAAEVADRTQAQAVIGALSTKSQSEITSLSASDKQQIISTATTAVINMTALGSSLDMDAISSGNANEEEIIESILNNCSATDTKCVTYILNDALTSSGTLNIPNDADPDEYKMSLTMGAVAVAASSLKGANFDMEDFMDAFDSDSVETVDDHLENMLPNGSAQDRANLKTALRIFAALGNDGFDPSAAFGA